MVTFDEFVKRLGKVQKFIVKETNNIIKNRSKEIIEMQRKQHHAGVSLVRVPAL